MLAPRKFLIGLYKQLLAGYIDSSQLELFQNFVEMWGEAQELVRAQQHVRQTMERTSRARSTGEWLEASALVDLVLGTIAHELLRVMFQKLLHEAEKAMCLGSDSCVQARRQTGSI